MPSSVRRAPSVPSALAVSSLVLLAGCAADLEDEDEHLSDEETGALFERAFAEEADEAADTPGCSGVRVPDRGPFAKRVALTFDDGPNPATTPIVLEVLRRYGIPATFFVNGSRVTSTTTRAIVRDVASDPLFIVGNHTQDHKDLATVSSAEVTRQIERTTDVLRAAGETPRFFRFPFGSSTCTTAQLVRNRGYRITGWHIDSADWCYASGNGYCAPRTFGEVPTELRRDMPSWVLRQVRANQGGIVLMHDIHSFTARALEGIVQTLLSEGYTFVALDDVSALPLLNGSAAPPPTPPPAPTPPPPRPPTVSSVLYPAGTRHSPITTDLVARLRAIAATAPRQSDDVFAKVGDSITASTSFLHCFDGTRVDLDGREALEPTLMYYGAGTASGSSPYTRTSLAATVGWNASAALAGNPSPVVRELDATRARLGVLMFGTNDVGFRSVELYARDMLALADAMIARGTIPLMSSIPPRDDSTAANAGVPLFNLAVRAIAQGRGVPFVDYHRELVPLPSHGLAGDRIHPQAHSGGACVLTADGLRFGANVRNLLTLEQLDRARRALDGEPAPDDDAPRLAGNGSAAAPFEITALPFATLADTRTSASRELAGYSCSTTNESGPELRYRLVLTARTRITAAAVSMTGADIDVHVLDSTGTAAGCLARDNRVVTRDLAPGTYYVVADTFVSGTTERAGEYLLLVSAD